MYESSPFRALLDPEERFREEERRAAEEARRQREEADFEAGIKARYLAFEGNESDYVRNRDAILERARRDIARIEAQRREQAARPQPDRAAEAERRRQQQEAEFVGIVKAHYLSQGGTESDWEREGQAVLNLARRGLTSPPPTGARS